MAGSPEKAEVLQSQLYELFLAGALSRDKAERGKFQKARQAITKKLVGELGVPAETIFTISKEAKEAAAARREERKREGGKRLRDEPPPI